MYDDEEVTDMTPTHDPPSVTELMPTLTVDPGTSVGEDNGSGPRAEDTAKPEMVMLGTEDAGVAMEAPTRRTLTGRPHAKIHSLPVVPLTNNSRLMCKAS